MYVMLHSKNIINLFGKTLSAILHKMLSNRVIIRAIV